jgi:hypothetical protein
MVEEGAIDKEIFEIYVEPLLVPTLESGQTVVMNKLTAHRGPRIRQLIEARSCELLYLPP